MTEIMAWITPVGSVVGLVTGAFVLVDRLFSGRPRADVAAVRAGPVVVLALTNTTRRNIYLESPTCLGRPAIATRTSQLGDFLGVEGYRTAIIPIAPGATVPIEVTPREAGDHSATLVLIWWSRGNLPTLPLFVLARWPRLRRMRPIE